MWTVVRKPSYENSTSRSFPITEAQVIAFSEINLLTSFTDLSERGRLGR
jgi:hypothetical protein